MAAITHTNAPHGAGGDPAAGAESGGSERMSDLQAAYREQCRAALDESGDRRDRDDADTCRGPSGKRRRHEGEPFAAAGWPFAPRQARERAAVWRFVVGPGDGQGGGADVDAGGTGSAGTGVMRPGAARAPGEAVHAEAAPRAGMRDATGEPAAAAAAHPRISRPAVGQTIPFGPVARATREPPGGQVGAAAPSVPAPPAAPLAVAAAGGAASPSSSAAAVRGDAMSRGAERPALPTPRAARTAGARPGRDARDDAGAAGDGAAGVFARAAPDMPLRPRTDHASGHHASRPAPRESLPDPARADARDVGEAPGTRVRYRFNSWAGRPAVELRFDLHDTSRVVTAQPGHERVRQAMAHSADRLTPGWTVEFDRRPDDGDRRAPWRRAHQEPEPDER
ncbi:SpaN/EivJ family type III secretion system needle length determinant [Burkholderia alba]|uniref:SpaN/EivJ family type III secretion system needle length determinant n=1 Tax=Burkholderia alba TaxID=2683677 RepID=UPI002B0601D1|nr:BsaU protein [Burkholderia alba]